MQGLNSLLNSPPQNQISLQELHSQIHPQPPMLFDSAGAATAAGSHDDFLHQILSSAPSWPQNDHFHGGDDSKLRHHQFLPSRFDAADSFQPPNQVGDGSVQALFNGFAGGEADQQHFHYAHDGSVQSYAPPGAAAASHQPPQQSGSAGAPAAQPRQRVRARRGQATDPHSIAERLRRERIAERMKALQEIVPNANKTDKASMLDEIIDYVKFLQLQVKVLSVSRLGGAGAVAPPVADISSAARGGGVEEDDEVAVTESQVAKLMEKDLGSAMQYLQGKGLCLMPISLATAISAAGTNNRRHNPFPASPSAQDASSVSMP